MTKLLDADWLRGVQLTIFPKTNKIVERYLHANAVDLEALKEKETTKIETKARNAG